MKFTFTGDFDHVLKEHSFPQLTKLSFTEILDCKYQDIDTYPYIFEFAGKAILSLSYIISRPNGEIHFSPKSGNRSQIAIALFDKDNKVYFPDSWEQVMSWGL